MNYFVRQFPAVVLSLLSSVVCAQPSDGSPHWIQGIGYTEPASEVRRLAFKNPGIIEELKVKLGQSVKAGEILSQQNNVEEQVAVKVAENQLQAAKANYQKTIAGINPFEIEAKKHAQKSALLETEFANRKLKRISQLEQKKFATEEDYDLAETNVSLKRTENLRLQSEVQNLIHSVRDVDRQASQQQVSVAEANLLAAQQHLAQTRLIAPIDGTVLEIIHYVGESTYVAGSPEPVILLGDISKLLVRAEIDENYALQLRNGQKAVLFGRGLGNREVPAHVSMVKQIMGKKTVFTKSATERKDIDVIQVFIEPEQPIQLPVGLELNVKIALDE